MLNFFKDSLKVNVVLGDALKLRYDIETIFPFRLNITPPASPVFGSSMKPSRRSVKRVRTEEESTGTKYSRLGNIQIKEENADGKYIKLFNSGSQVSVCFALLNF